MSDLETGEHTPAARPQARTKSQERADFWIRMTKLVVGPVMAAVVAIGVAYVQRSSDRHESDAADEKILKTSKKTTKDVIEELNQLKAQVETVASAAQTQAKIVTETHDEAAPKKRRRARAGDPPKLIDKVEASIKELERVKEEAQKPVSVTVPPEKVPDKAPEISGGGGATSNPRRGARE